MRQVRVYVGCTGNVSFRGEEIIVTSEAISAGDLSVTLEKFTDKRIDSIDISSCNGLKIEMERSGWVIRISEDTDNRDILIVTRFKRPKVGETVKTEYLMKNGEWLPEPKGLGPLPPNALRVPISVPEEVMVH